MIDERYRRPIPRDETDDPSRAAFIDDLPAKRKLVRRAWLNNAGPGGVEETLHECRCEEFPQDDRKKREK